MPAPIPYPSPQRRCGIPDGCPDWNRRKRRFVSCRHSKFWFGKMKGAQIRSTRIVQGWTSMQNPVRSNNALGDALGFKRERCPAGALFLELNRMGHFTRKISRWHAPKIPAPQYSSAVCELPTDRGIASTPHARFGFRFHASGIHEEQKTLRYPRRYDCPRPPILSSVKPILPIRHSSC